MNNIANSTAKGIERNILMNPGNISQNTFANPVKRAVGNQVLHGSGGKKHRAHGVAGAVQRNVERTAMTHPSNLSVNTITRPLQRGMVNSLLHH